MAENNTAYQCPNCTGPLQFNAKIGKMKCDFCLSEFDVEEIKSKYAEKNMKAEGQEAQEAIHARHVERSLSVKRRLRQQAVRTAAIRPSFRQSLAVLISLITAYLLRSKRRRLLLH